jgi:hypothetical protein
MKWLDTTNNTRTWIFRILVAAAVVLMLVSFSMPWWTTDGTASSGSFFIRIYGHGLQHNMDQLQEYIAADETPAYQTALAWVYVGVSSAIALLAAWLKGKKSMFLLGVVGLGYIAYALAAVFMVVKNRLADSGIALQGVTDTGLYKQLGMSFDSGITTGFYLALAAGAAFIVLALLSKVIRGSRSSSGS